MAMQAIFKFRNADSTVDFNNRVKDLFSKGLFTACNIIPGVGLTVDIPPFSAISYDGMVIIETIVTNTLNVSAGHKNYLVLRAKYNTGSDPTLQFESLTSDAYLIDPDKNYLIVFATVTLSSGAISVNPTDISTGERDIIDPLGRNIIRGLRTIAPVVSGNDRIGDTYFVAPGYGNTPSMYVFNGVAFEDISATTLSTVITKHRSNSYHAPRVEQHLTDNEKDAVIGATGIGIPTPSINNRFVTDQDTRLPTLLEKAALAGSQGIPSSTNRYLTEAEFTAEPTEISLTAAGYSQKLIATTSGPFYVGNASPGTAKTWFNLYRPSSNEEYTNASDIPVTITGIYKNAGLTSQLDPSDDADVNGFYSSDIWIAFNNNVNTSYDLVYGKKVTYKNIGTKALIERGPRSAQINKRLIELWEDLKESSLATDIPPDETLPALKRSQGSVREYLSASFNTDIVTDEEAYRKLSNISTFSGDFPYNVGLNSNTINNPRDANLASALAKHGTETITVDEVIEIPDEFSVDDWPAYRIYSPKSDNRIRLYGSWRNEIDNYSKHASAPDMASVMITFYGTGIDILTNLKPDITPTLTTVIDGITGPVIDVGVSGEVSPALSDQNYNAAVPIGITGDLSVGIHTVEVGITNATGSFELHGFRIKHDVGSTGAFDELPGRVFSEGQLVKLDTINSFSPPSVTSSGDKGFVIDRFVNRITGAHTVDTNIVGIEGYRVLAVPISAFPEMDLLLGYTTANMRVNDIIIIEDNPQYQYAVIEQIVTSDRIRLQNNAWFSSGNARLTLYARVGGSIGDTGDIHEGEEIVRRLDPLKFTANRFDDFANLSTGNTSDASFTLEDNLTTLVAEDFILGTLDGRVSVGSVTSVAYQSASGVHDGIEDGDYFTVSGTTFEFNTGTVTPGNVKIAAGYGDTPVDLQIKIIEAINGATGGLVANTGLAATVDIAEDTVGPNNVAIVESISNGLTLTPVGMANGANSSPINIDNCIIGVGSSSKIRLMFKGTGLDIVTANTNALGSTRSLKIDGIDLGPTSFLTIPSDGMVKIPVISHLPYGTHVVEIGTEGVAIAYFLLYEPESNIDGSSLYKAMKLASNVYTSTNVFRGTTTGDGITGDAANAIVQGSVVHTCNRELRLINGSTGGSSGSTGDWNKSLLNVDMAPKAGFILSTLKQDAYFEMNFWGTGFQLEYPTTLSGGISNIYLDGIIVNSANYSSATISSTLDSTTGKLAGQINQYSISTVNSVNNIYAYDFDLGYHTLRVQLTDTNKHLYIELVHIFTDYASNVSETTTITHERFEANNTLRDMRVVTALEEPETLPEVTTIVHTNEDETITGNYTWERLAGASAIRIKRDSDANYRFSINSDGKIVYGDGLHAPSLFIERTNDDHFRFFADRVILQSNQSEVLSLVNKVTGYPYLSLRGQGDSIKGRIGVNVNSGITGDSVGICAEEINLGSTSDGTCLSVRNSFVSISGELFVKTLTGDGIKVYGHSGDVSNISAKSNPSSALVLESNSHVKIDPYLLTDQIGIGTIPGVDYRIDILKDDGVKVRLKSNNSISRIYLESAGSSGSGLFFSSSGGSANIEHISSYIYYRADSHRFYAQSLPSNVLFIIDDSYITTYKSIIPGITGSTFGSVASRIAKVYTDTLNTNYVSSHLIPSANYTYNLGATGTVNFWNKLAVRDIDVGSGLDGTSKTYAIRFAPSALDSASIQFDYRYTSISRMLFEIGSGLDEEFAFKFSNIGFSAKEVMKINFARVWVSDKLHIGLTLSSYSLDTWITGDNVGRVRSTEGHAAMYIDAHSTKRAELNFYSSTSLTGTVRTINSSGDMYIGAINTIQFYSGAALNVNTATLESNGRLTVKLLNVISSSHNAMNLTSNTGHAALNISAHTTMTAAINFLRGGEVISKVHHDNPTLKLEINARNGIDFFTGNSPVFGNAGPEIEETGIFNIYNKGIRSWSTDNPIRWKIYQATLSTSGNKTIVLHTGNTFIYNYMVGVSALIRPTGTYQSNYNQTYFKLAFYLGPVGIPGPTTYTDLYVDVSDRAAQVNNINDVLKIIIFYYIP